jgi:putative redox protein
MTPLELMLASLGACAGYYAAQYLRKKGLATEGTLVRVSAEKKTGPARLDDFRVEIDLPLACGAEHRKAVKDAVHRCPVHNTLLNPPKIAIDIKEGPIPKAA